MPPKKQSKPKFRKGVRGGKVGAVKKGKKKASQKQIVNVTVTSTGSGSGGSSMGVPSQPIFMPNTYQQPLFTPAVDPIKNTLSEVLKEPTAKKVSRGSQFDKTEIPDEIPVETPAKKFSSWGFDGTPTRTPAKEQQGWGFDDVYGSNPMYKTTHDDSGFYSAPESVPRPQQRPLPQPRVPTPIPDGTGLPVRTGAGRQVNLSRHPHETDSVYFLRMERNRTAREKRQRDNLGK